MNIQKLVTLFAFITLPIGCMNAPLNQFDCRIRGLECAEGFVCIVDDTGQFACQPDSGQIPDDEHDSNPFGGSDTVVTAEADASVDEGIDDHAGAEAHALPNDEIPDGGGSMEAAEHEPTVNDANPDRACSDDVLEGLIVRGFHLTEQELLALCDCRFHGCNDDAVCAADASGFFQCMGVSEEADAVADEGNPQDAAEDENTGRLNLLSDDEISAHDDAEEDNEDAANELGDELVLNNQEMVDEIEEAEEAPSAEELVDRLSIRRRAVASIVTHDVAAEGSALQSYAGYGPNAIDVNHVRSGNMCVDIRPAGRRMSAFTEISAAGTDSDINGMPEFSAALSQNGLSGSDVGIATGNGTRFDPNDVSRWQIFDDDGDGAFDSEIRLYRGPTEVDIRVGGNVIAFGTASMLDMNILYNDLSDCADDDIGAESDAFTLTAAPGSDLGQALVRDLNGRRVRLVVVGEGTSATLLPTNGVAQARLDTLSIETE